MLCDQVNTIRFGDIADFSNFMGAFIDDRAWTRLSKVIATADADAETELVFGAKADKSTGYFVGPTLYKTSNLNSPLVRDELFGPIASVVLFEEQDFDSIVRQIDKMSAYGLTGSIFARIEPRSAKLLTGSATPPEIFTSTTNRRGRSLVSSRSAAHVPQARTTKPVRCGI